ncbi:kinase-like domain-containing protein [Phycomyces nitens]|nr:kinase-like domain-containing protein [Phycomyces nitens]
MASDTIHPPLPEPVHQQQHQQQQQQQQQQQDPVTVADVDDPSHPLFHHRRTVNDFDYGDVLGEGSYSTVMVGRDRRTGKYYAIKKLDKAHIVKNDKVKYVMIERDALSRMNHPGIIKLYWTFKDHRSLYFVLDLAKNGELYSYIRRLAPFDIDTARFYAAEIISTLDHIHSKDVIHRDIKPENILLDDNMHIKITDFGSAKIGIVEKEDAMSSSKDTTEDGENANEKPQGRSRSFVGTAEYVSPELLRSEPTSKEADLWAFGCVLFQMLSGKSPFKAPTDYLIFQNIKNLEYSIPDYFPDDARDLIQRLLVLEPSERIGSDKTGGIEAIRQHPFFYGIDWDTLFESPAPPLRERLEKEMARQAELRARQKAENGLNDEDDDDDDDDDEEEAWFGTNRVQQGPTSSTTPANQYDPFGDPLRLQYDNHHAHLPLESARISSTAYPPPVVATSRHDSRHGIINSVRSDSTRSMSPERLGGQSHPPWVPHLYPNESILKAGKVVRRPGFFSRKRYLILTNRPRLLYMDEGKEPDGSGGKLRSEIGWTPQLLPELKGKSVFCIHTPHKSYTFEDPEGRAQEWVNTINTMLVDSFGLAA